MSNHTHVRSLVLSLSIAVALASPGIVWASGGGDAKKEVSDPYVKLASVAIPIFEGQTIRNYIFLTVRLNLSPKADLNKLREKEPYFRDRLVKTAYRISFGTADRHDTLDEARFKKVMMTEFASIAGPGMIQTIEVLDKTPKRRQR